MTPSFIGRYAVISPGVRPTISLASLPTASILLSRTETATTEGSLRTIPLPGTKTSTVVVPRSMPSLGEKEKAIRSGIVLQCPKVPNPKFQALKSYSYRLTMSLFFFLSPLGELLSIGLRLGGMIFRIDFPPEFFREVTRIVAHLLQIVQVFGRYRLKQLPHPSHRDRRKPVAQTGAVELVAEILHELPALGGARFVHRFLDMYCDVLHGFIVHFPL